MRTRITLLQVVVRVGNVEVLRELLEAGAAVDEVGDGKWEGWPPLHECVLHQGREDMMDILIQQGANIDVLSAVGWYLRIYTGQMGITPLHLAMKEVNSAAVAKLKTCRYSRISLSG